MPVSVLDEHGIRVAAGSDISGHLDFLRQCAARAGGSPAVAEFGVRTGNSTCALLAGLADAGGGALWSADPQAPQLPPWRERACWRFLQAASTSVQAQEFFPLDLDVLFIDSHDDDWSPEQVTASLLAELELYVPRIRPGGVVLAHDTEWMPPGMQLPGPYGPVAAGLDLYCQAHGMSWQNRPGCYGLGVLYPIS